MLIKESGCDKIYVGDAKKISDKHCNFFVNNGKAKAADIETLIKKVKQEVFSKIRRKFRIRNKNNWR